MVPRRNWLLFAPGTPTKRRMEVRSLPRTLLSVRETWDSIECVQTSDAASRLLGSVASSSSSRPNAVLGPTPSDAGLHRSVVDPFRGETSCRCGRRALGFRELSSDFCEGRDRGSCPNYESNASDKNAPRNRLRNKVRRAGGVSAVDRCRVIGTR